VLDGVGVDHLEAAGAVSGIGVLAAGDFPEDGQQPGEASMYS